MAWRDLKGRMWELLPVLQKTYPKAGEADVFYVMNLGCWERKDVLLELLILGDSELCRLAHPLNLIYRRDERAINCTSGNNLLH
jgi:hypothetical protein